MLICKIWYLFEKFLRNNQGFGTFGCVLELKEEKTTISLAYFNLTLTNTVRLISYFITVENICCLDRNTFGLFNETLCRNFSLLSNTHKL